LTQAPANPAGRSLLFEANSDPSKWILFKIVSVAAYTGGFFDFVVTFGGGGTALVANDALVVEMWPAEGSSGGAATSISDTPPASPVAGQLWFESDTGNTFIYYTDADSSQWVQVSAAPSTPVGLTAETRSRIVNGAMQISQENGYTGTANVTALSYYAADQWPVVSNTSPGTANALRVAATTPNGSRDRVRLVVGTAKAALAAGDYLIVQTILEGIRIADFGWGTAQARQVVFRFGFKAPAGTYSIAITNGVAVNRTYLANFTISAGQANTDTVQTFVIPGDTTGTWPNDSSTGMYLTITAASGTTFQGVAGWNAGNLMRTAANSNGMATAGNVFELFDVGLYLDPLATGTPPAWTMPDYADDLRACRRYYAYYDALWIIQSGYAAAGTAINMTFPFQTSTRSTPAVTFGALGNSNTTTTTPSAASIGVDAVYAGIVASTTGAMYCQVSVTVNARM
jgi:hypothetical protein